jgi:hypothetical protein
MIDYVIRVETDAGIVTFNIQADNDESAQIFADQMNQGYVYVYRLYDDE